MNKKLLFLMFLTLLSACSSSNNTPDNVQQTKQLKIQLESQLALSGNLTDVWGYVDLATGKEYALVGFGSRNGGVHIVDVSNAKQPARVATVNNIAGFDVKVWQHYFYTVNGGSSGTGAIVDIADPANPQVVGSFSSAHNIFITDNGTMFMEFPGLRIMDLNADPLNPKQIWRGGSEGHDATVVGNRLYDFHGSRGTNIYDISSPSSPQLRGSISAPTVIYHHSGWPTKDGNYLLLCDEGARHPTNDITMWDIHDPGNPELVDSYQDSTAIVHNLYIIDELAFVSYYNSGFRLFDVSQPGEMTLMDEFDTTPATGEVFGGAFGVYPFAPSGFIYVSDSKEGLFIFSIQDENTNAKMILAP